MAVPVRRDHDYGGFAKITGLPDPSSAQDAATKAYADRGIKDSDLAKLTASQIALADYLGVRDVSDTSMAATGTNKEILVGDIIDKLRLDQGLPLVKYKTADQSNSSNTTLADVTDMAWAMAVSGEYVLEVICFVVSAATTTGLVLALNGPASPTAVQYSMESPTSGTAGFHSGATAYETALVATGVLSTTLPQAVRLWGHIRNGSNAGDLQLRMRSEVSGSNTTIRRGSFGRLTRVA